MLFQVADDLCLIDKLKIGDLVIVERFFQLRIWYLPYF